MVRGALAIGVVAVLVSSVSRAGAAVDGLLAFGDVPMGSAVSVSWADGSRSSQLTGEGWMPSWSRDGSELAYESNVGVVVWTAATDGYRVVVSPGYDCGWPSWGPSGAQLVCSGGSVVVFSVVSGRPEWVAARPAAGWSLDEASWGPSRVVFVSSRPGTGFELLRSVSHFGGAWWYLGSGQMPSYSRDGGWIVFASSSNVGLWVESSTGADRHQIPVEGCQSVTWWPHFSPNGRWIVFQCGSDVDVVSAHGGVARVVGVGMDPSWQAKS